MTESRNIIYPHVSNMIWDKRVFQLKEHVITEIAKSYTEVGQLQPIVVSRPPEGEDGPFKLIIGRHRYGAAKKNYKEIPNYAHTFLGQPCPEGTLAAIDVRDLSPELLLNMEISENVHRMDLTWQEKAQALAQIHEVERARHERAKEAGEIAPDVPYTMSDTAKKLAGVTGGSENAILNKVSQSLILAQRLDDPDVARADSAKSAFNVLKNKLTAAARQLSVNVEEGKTQHELFVGDCGAIMSSWVEALETDQGMDDFVPYDLILADPPYGIGADSYDNMREHKYDDSWENAQKIYTNIAGFGFELTKPRANLILFCTPERWHDVRDIAEDAGWVSWPRPLIWRKSNEGMRPWGQQGLAYTYECIYFGTKGQKGLIATANDVFEYYKPKSSEREHAAAKPVELYSRLMELTCLPGDRVLDPCVGSGTSFKAGFLRNLRVTGIENNEETAAIARKNLYWTGKDNEPARVEPEPIALRTLGDL